ncbi:MAG: hypothetical protein QOF89_6146 [Acidobacteriota bacterium]|jgi:hypothetical protein|nr:hypothetical protein [Acidobacteriota bacterium]
MHLKAGLLATAAVLFVVPQAFAYCRTDPHQTYDVSSLKMINATQPDSQANLFDYGIIFEDADDTDAECQDWAAIALSKKVRWTLALPYYQDTPRFGTTFVGPYQGWLEGANVSLVYAAALRLGAKGRLTKPLAGLIDQISYVQNIDRNCGFVSNRKGQYGVWVNGNSCMDDWAVAASGSAWAAAWKAARSRPATQVQAAANAAKAAIANAFNLTESVCAHRPGDPMPAIATSDGPCTGSVAELAAGTAVALGLHNGDAIPYGLGLITSIASADVALGYAGYPPTYTADQKTVAKALYKNGDLHTTAGGDFKTDCYRFTNQSGLMYRYSDFACREAGFGGVGYQPEMFPVYEFFNRRLGGAPVAVNYSFNTFDGGLFCDNFTTCVGGFWSPGRRAIYGKLGYAWVVSRPPLSADLGDYTVKLKTYDGVHYVSARNGGGSDVNAEASAATYDETFSLVDVNGGQLMSGDVVYLQVLEGQYITANDGGGSDVVAQHYTPVGWERFTIEKTWGTGQIVSGNPVAFRTENGHYWSAIDGGGGELLAPYLGVVTWEVFTIDLTHN